MIISGIVNLFGESLKTLSVNGIPIPTVKSVLMIIFLTITMKPLLLLVIPIMMDQLICVKCIPVLLLSKMNGEIITVHLPVTSTVIVKSLVKVLGNVLISTKSLKKSLKSTTLLVMLKLPWTTTLILNTSVPSNPLVMKTMMELLMLVKFTLVLS